MSPITAFGLFCFTVISVIMVAYIITDFLYIKFDLSDGVSIFIFGVILSSAIAVAGLFIH